jgi:L-fuculose-phosphate aldolase
MQTDDKTLREGIVSVCVALNRQGLSRGTSGNVSVRSGEDMLISPTGVPYHDLAPEMIVRVHMDGAFEGTYLPSSEWRFHRDIYVRRPELNAVVHNHSPHATAMAIMGLDIPPVHYSIAAVGGPDIRCGRYATFGSPELAKNALEALEGRRACLLEHHGVIAAGVSLEKAFGLAEIVEEMARLYILASALGAPRLLSNSDIEKVLQRHQTYGQQPAVAG